MKKILVLFVLVLSLGLHSCKQEIPKFVGEWSLDKMDLNGEVIYGNILGRPSYIFYENNKYLIQVSGENEMGTWKYKDNVITLYSKEIDKTSKLTIQEISDKSLVYLIGEESVSTVFLKKE